MIPQYLFEGLRLEQGLIADIMRMNPWWKNEALPVLPQTRRHIVAQITSRMERRLAPIVVVRGPRQIGKTTAQLQIISDLLASGISPDRILRLQFDDLPEIGNVSEPILRIVEWYEKVVLKKSLNDSAHVAQIGFLFFDEIQNLKKWDVQLKSLVDHSTANIVVTGSSALRIEKGRDSLAGRINTLETGVMTLTEISRFYDINLGDPFLPDNGTEILTDTHFWRELKIHANVKQEDIKKIFLKFSERGGYPLVHAKREVPWEHIADQLNENVVKRVIQHDLRVGERGRKRDENLLKEVFALACRYIGQSIQLDTFAREANRTLHANVGPLRIQHYLKFLGDTLLLRIIPPLEIRLKRKRGGPKICLADHALRASWLEEYIPLDPEGLEKEPHLTTLAGHIAESVVGATLSSITGLDIAHYPQRKGEPEVDFVITSGTKRVPLEVKYQRKIDPLRDTEGLRSFMENVNNKALFGIMITQTAVESVADPRIITIPLSTFMLLR